jgi:RND family efflux transporter MFP subunit
MIPSRSLIVGLILVTVGPAARAANSQEADCLIEPHVVADVSSAIPGVLDTLEVQRGDVVNKGDVLATLESSVERATVGLAEAKADMVHLIKARRARMEFTKRRLERNAELFKKKAISDQDVDEAETEAVLAEMEFEQAMEEKQIATLELQRAQESLALRTIRSPIDGVVVEVFVAPGESVEDRALMQIAQVDPLNVEVIAPVRQFGKIHKGMGAEVRPEAPIGGVYRGTVVIVDQVVDAPSGTFGVRAELPNEEHKLPAGLRCRVRFLTEQPVPGAGPLRLPPPS